MKKIVFILLSLGYIYLLVFDFLPLWTTWVYFGSVAVALLFAKSPQKALEIFFLIVPFFLALPNPYSDSLSMWRPLVLLLFIRVFWPRWSHLIKDYRLWQNPEVPAKFLKNLKEGLFKLELYEKLGLALWILAFASLWLASYKLRGMEQLIFLLNAGLVYPITVSVLRNGGELKKLVCSLAWSTGVLVFLGFFQLLLSIGFPFYYFWQFWAMQVASLFYGRELSSVLTYSNSWFSLEGGMQNLRMFSFLPSSHAFAMVAVFFLSYLTPVLAIRLKRKKVFPINKERYLKTGKPVLESLKEFWSGRMPVWYALRFAGLGIILSGTRGVWVGILAPFFLALAFWHKKVLTAYAKLWVMVMSLVILFFVLSPVINTGLNYLRMTNFRENFLERASSIYDLEETSNVGRLQIWQESLRFSLSHPLGVGYGNFITTLTAENQSFEEAGEERNKRYNLPQKFVTAHSLYLQLLVELSLVGLLLFIAFWLSFFFKVWTYLVSQKVELGYEQLYVFGTALIMVWFLAYSTFDLTWLNDKILLYTFVSLGIIKSIIVNKKPNNI